MRRAAGLLLAGLLAIVVQGGLAALVAPHWLPDMSLLVVVAAALLLRPAEALVVAAVCGLTADSLSGALLGQQAFLRVLEVALTRAVGAQIDLRRGFPLAVFVLALSALDWLGMTLLVRAFLDWSALGFAGLAPHAVRAVMNAVCAPLVVMVLRAGVERLDESALRSELRLDTRRHAR